MLFKFVYSDCVNGVLIGSNYRSLFIEDSNAMQKYEDICI